MKKNIPKAPKVDKKLLRELKNRKKAWEELLESMGAILWDQLEAEDDRIIFGQISTDDEDEDAPIIDFNFSEENKAGASYMGKEIDGTWTKVFRQIIKWKKSAIPPVPKQN